MEQVDDKVELCFFLEILLQEIVIDLSFVCTEAKDAKVQVCTVEFVEACRPYIIERHLFFYICRRHCAIMVSSAQFQPQLQPGECITKLLVLCVGAGGGSGWCTGGGGSGYYRTILFAAVDGSPGLLFSVVSSKNAKRQVFNPKHGVPVIVGLPRKGNAGSSSLFGDFLIAEGGQGTCFFSDTTGRSGGSGAGASQTSAVGRLLFKLGKGGCAGGHGQRTAFASGGTGQGAVPDLSVFQLHKLRYGDAGSGDDKFATGAGGVEIEGFPVPSNCASQPAALVQHGRGFGAGAGEVASGIASGASGLVYIEWESVIPVRP